MNKVNATSIACCVHAFEVKLASKEGRSISLHGQIDLLKVHPGVPKPMVARAEMRSESDQERYSPALTGLMGSRLEFF